MKSELISFHIAALILAVLTLWSLRHEFTERAANRAQWALPPVLAIATAAILLYVSPGKRIEMWAAAIVIGLLLGGVMGVVLKINQDFGQKLIRVARSWDGLAAASLLLLLALTRFVSSDLTARQSGGFGILGALAIFCAMFLVSRYLIARFYNAPKSIHLDLVRGHNPHRTLIN
jgi:hypothetical protein